MSLLSSKKINTKQKKSRKSELEKKNDSRELPFNWRSTSIAGKITAVVVWGVMPIAFAITIPLLSSLEEEINKDHLWKLEQVHISLDKAYQVDPSISHSKNIEILRDKLFFLKNMYEFDYLKLEYSDNTVVIGQKLPNSSVYTYDSINRLNQKDLIHPSEQDFNFELTLCFPAIERGIELERMKYGSLIVIFTIILGLYLVYVIRNTLHDPFQKVIDATQSVKDGNLDTRLDIQSNDEFGYLSHFFNHMVEELEIQQQCLTDSNKYLESVVKNKEMALEESRAKSLFLANMSHEIRTPMTAIHGYAENLYRFGITDKKEQSDALETIYRNSKHLINIINDILDLSKIEADKLDIESLSFSPVKLMDEVEQLMALHAKEKGVDLNFIYEFPLPETIINDPTRFKQILFNLISNALKFTTEGSVTVTISCFFKEEKIHVSVADNGIGLSDEQINHLFQPYVQAHTSTARKYGGTGLGLMISRRLVNLMGGDIIVDSVVGEGAVFEFDITTGDLSQIKQMTEIKKTHLKPSNDADNIPKMSGRVLLVEDIVDNQKLISLYLRQAGLNIEIANNGKEALNKAFNQEYNLILMDIQMPIMDGLTATKSLREANYETPIIALTANVLKNERDIYLQAGFNDILTKPIILDEFYLTIQSWLQIRNSSEPVRSKAIKSEENSLFTSNSNEDIYQSLVKQFLISLSSELIEINESIKKEDWSSCQKLMHNIKGRGGSFGYQKMTDLASELEVFLKANNFVQFRQQFIVFHDYCQEMISESDLS
ncbi:MAG: ATP-binding protein [Gammaproteobacteria bacterium]|nr:ATP-binding protein [Gammaproteobacteria bacterium]